MGTREGVPPLEGDCTSIVDRRGREVLLTPMSDSRYQVRKGKDWWRFGYNGHSDISLQKVGSCSLSERGKSLSHS